MEKYELSWISRAKMLSRRALKDKSRMKVLLLIVGFLSLLFLAINNRNTQQSGNGFGLARKFSNILGGSYQNKSDEVEQTVPVKVEYVPPWIPRQSVGSQASKDEIQQLLSQASRELEPWKNGVSLEMVERLYCIDDAEDSMRIQIIKNRVYVVGPNPTFQTRFQYMEKQLLNLVAENHIPDVDFVLQTTDYCMDYSQPARNNKPECDKNAPLFAFSRHPDQRTCAMMPDFGFGGWPEAFVFDWGSTRSWMTMSAHRYPFRKRSDKIFWRGADTHPQRAIMARSQPVQESGLADIKLLSWDESPEDFQNHFISLPEHCRHKHLLQLEGHTWSGRLRILMLCKAAVVFPFIREKDPHEFWYHLLKDRENIVLTSKIDEGNDGNNILDAVRELQQNETLAESIGRKGHHLASEILHPDNIQKYWVELLTRYKALMTFHPTLHPDAVPIEVNIMRPAKTVSSRDRTCNIC